MLKLLLMALAALIPLLHTLGMLLALHAIWWARTSNGAIAWAVSLVSFPYLAIPAYLVFGQDRFHNYTQALRAGSLEFIHPDIHQFFSALDRQRGEDSNRARVFERLARVPLTTSHVELLIDGEATYARIHQEIEKAEKYVLVEYFIVNDDGAGRALKDLLLKKARQGVSVRFIYDELGSQHLEKGYAQEMRAAGIEVWPFYTTRGWRNRFQLNFRNHRKIVIVDGHTALVGGLNIGDEELGKSKWYGPWRDTHTVLRGPAVMGVQMVFAEDYHWATGGNWSHDLNWTPVPVPTAEMAAAYVSSGPADHLEVNVLFFLECINAARERLWIASPYFVPDNAILEALKLADLRGVEVRILLPNPRYEPHMTLAALSFLPDLKTTGIGVYRFPGYNHSKVMLIDDDLAWVGSSNLDNRSLRLNFEGNLVVTGQAFARQVEEMLARDFARSHRLGMHDVRKLGWLSELGVKVVRLFSPIL